MKKLILFAFIVISHLAVNAQNVLYFADGLAGPDQMSVALTNLGYNVTTVTNHSAFQTAIATPANFDLAIHFIQSDYPDPASVNGMANFMAIPGKKGMYSDWSTNNTYGAMFGVNFTGNTNNGTVTITDPGLAAGLTTNPFNVFQSGWGVYSTGLIPLAGGNVLGTFSNGEAALVETMSGNMFVFGYTTDAVTTSEFFENALVALLPPVPPTITTTTLSGNFCQHEILTVDFTTTGYFSGGNMFTAQLSDATGSFATPTAIGTLSGTTSGSVTSTIPVSALPGSGYRIRVVSSTPGIDGSDNGSDLGVLESPIALVSTTPFGCKGDLSTVTIAASNGTPPYTGLGTFTWPAGPYNYTVMDGNGCTSAAATGTITEPAAITYNQNVTLCNGESVIVGTNTYTTAGTFTDLLVNGDGCDSTVTTTITIGSVNVTTSVAGTTITANAVAANYQWLDCGNGNAVIAGEISVDFTPNADGAYAVEITQGGCTDTSACITISTAGIHSNDISTLNIYPNPANGFFTLKAESVNAGTVILTLSDLQGRIILTSQEQITSTNFVKQISLENIEAGIYYVQLTQGDSQRTSKLVIQ